MTSPDHSKSEALEPVAVVVVNYGSHHLLETNLRSLTGQPGVTIVVVDSYSTSQERQSITALASANTWTLVCPDHNTGFGDGCNLGAQAALEAGCQTLVFLNPDARIETADLWRLASLVRIEPGGLAAPIIRNSAGKRVFDAAEVEAHTGRIRRAHGTFVSGPQSWLTGAVFATTSDWWRRLGGFDSDYFLYWEDVDLSRKCVDLGGKLMLDEESTAVHDSSSTQVSARATVGKSNVYYYWNCRNRLVFAAKHLGGANLARWLLWTPVESARIYLRGGRRQIMERPSSLLPVMRGTLDGVLFAVRSRWRAARQARSGAA